MNAAASYLEVIETDWLGIVTAHPRRTIELAGHPLDWSGQMAEAEYCSKCGTSVGPGEFDQKKGCATCRNRRYPWDAIHRLGAYHEDLRHWTHTVKFQRWDTMGIELGRRLGESLTRAGVEADAVVAVPSTFRRRIRRGIDHSAVIALGVSQVVGLPILRPLSREARPPQRAVADSRRRENIRRAFRMRRWHWVSDLRLILVDDITTSRATLIEATRTLKQAGAAGVTIGILAATDSPRRPGVPSNPS